MQNKTLPLLMTSSLLLTTQVSHANSQTHPCLEGVKNPVSALRCLDTAIEKQNNAITMWQNKHALDLAEKEKKTGNTQLVGIFNRAKDAYSIYLTSSCRVPYLQALPDTTKAALEYKLCELTLGKSRLTHLQALSGK